MSYVFHCDRCGSGEKDPVLSMRYRPGNADGRYRGEDAPPSVIAELCNTCALSFSEWLAAGGKKV